MSVIRSILAIITWPARKLSSMLGRQSVGFKVYGALSSLLILLAAVGGIALHQIEKQNFLVDSFYNQTTSADWLRQSVSDRADLLQYLWTAAANYERGNPQSAASPLKDFDDSIAHFRDKLGRYDDELSRAEKLGQDRAAERKAYRDWAKEWDRIEPVLKSGSRDLRRAELDKAQAITLAGQLSDELLIINDYFSSVSEELRLSGKKLSAQAQEGLAGFRKMSIGIGILGLLVTVLMFWQMRRTVRNLRVLARAVGSLAVGDVESAERALQ
jgi:hypothetical protein